LLLLHCMQAVWLVHMLASPKPALLLLLLLMMMPPSCHVLVPLNPLACLPLLMNQAFCLKGQHRPGWSLVGIHLLPLT
jgi:hypothetical protein